MPTDTTAVAVPHYTLEQANELCLPGWNLRCNRCGSYGADWMPNERPGWGCLALCPPHKRELVDEHVRHKLALEVLRRVDFEQDGCAVREFRNRKRVKR